MHPSASAPSVSTSQRPDRLSPIELEEGVAALHLAPFGVERLKALLAVLPAAIPGQHKEGGSADHDFQDTLALEDLFGVCGCFTNMFDGRPSSPAAYGTLLDYDRLDVALRLLGRDRFNRNQWRSIVGYWRHTSYLSPILGMLAAQLARFVNLPDPLAKDDDTGAFYASR